MKQKTVLMTGTSSGIGKATAIYFQNKGWNVIATMRNPENARDLKNLPNLLCTKLDVTKPNTIEKAIEEGIKTFGEIDVLVNNAGYGLIGPFEGAAKEQIQRQFDTNLFGAMDVIQKILPHFRKKRKGLIINVASMGGRITIPLYSLYHSTKWALEGFTESLQYELHPLGIRVKLIEPGAIATDFISRSSESTSEKAPEEYKKFSETVFKNMENAMMASRSETVAKVIFKAAKSPSKRFRYVVGTDAIALLGLRKFLSDRIFFRIIKLALLKSTKVA
ncbi:SDR family oxidoreductase [Leptospira alexanderi]|uniref:Oxidoreductase, short chain dehydrogenase/reductase family protein n=1 Tax=Leptospira alexanderi serovar Manhao 3 str. L 60 TaxID=1049759 RepID=V6I374_9LEPT|nr:SDR family oxidoreductase [Leptospira alexanderi]EQA64012.1 oxidoreductase, short chain dehydrogenase/reductase family protein [Leptospira alexanderi serovar Manhao 3 str. L 60]